MYLFLALAIPAGAQCCQFLATDGIDEAKYPALRRGGRSAASRPLLVGPQVVGADHRFASLVDELGHLLPVGRVAKHHRVGPAAELHPPRQIQVIIQDAADALVGVAR